MGVVYFDQGLGCKRWLKSSFLTFLTAKSYVVMENLSFWGIKPQCFGANFKNMFFLLKFAANFLLFCVFLDFYHKNGKNLDFASTSVWDAQHPNSG